MNEHGNYGHDSSGHIKHKYDFAAILNFHFEVEQRSYEKLQVVIEIIHKHRITGEKVEGIIKVPISDLKHGEYTGGWHDVFSSVKGKKKDKEHGKKIGELSARLLLHKEGLSKEQRRNTITKNIKDLDSVTSTMSNSEGLNLAVASKTQEDWRGAPVAVSTTQSVAGGGQPTQLQIEAEARLTRLEQELARAVEMMSNVAEAVAKLSQ